MVLDYFLSEDDKREMLAAAILRFRGGEIGPLTFRAECEKLKIDYFEISQMINQYSDECARALRGGRLPFKSGVYRGGQN